jgi:hypothetical protein
MAAIADAIELFLHLLSKDANTKPLVAREALNAGIGFCYVAFAFGWLVVWTKFSDRSFSCVLTAASCIQLLGFLTLTVKVRGTKSVAGISSKTLELYLLFFITRLGSTLWKSGYIPVDRSGRNIYQLMDVCSCLVVVQLLFCVHKTHKWTYQGDHDNFPVMPLIPPCVILAYFIHANLNRSFFFDVIWATSTNLDSIAMLPQLWMMTKIGGQVAGCTAHFVFAMVASRVLALLFWSQAFLDLQGEGSELAGKQIVAAHVIQLLLAADFLYYYLKAKFAGKVMRLPEQTDGVRTTMDI